MTIVAYALGFLGDFIVPFIKALIAARANDENLLTAVQNVVTGIDKDHPDWSGSQKRDYALSALQTHFKTLGKDVADSVINTLIELAVQKMKAPQA